MSLLGHLKMADGYPKQPEPDAFERSRVARADVV